MAPIVSGVEAVPVGSPIIVAFVVASSVAVALSLALFAVICGCCGKKKPEETPATDEKSAKNPEPAPPSEPEKEAPKSETKEPSAKGPASAKSDKPEQSMGSGPTMKMQRANDLELMSAVGGGKSYGKAGGDTKTRMSGQPSLVLAGQSTVQDGKGAAAPSSKAKSETAASTKAGGASVTLDPVKTKTEAVSQTAKSAKTSKKVGGVDDEKTQAPTIKTAKTTRSTTEATTTVGGTTTAATSTVGGATTAGTTTKATTKTEVSKAGKSSASKRGQGGEKSELDRDLNTSVGATTTGAKKPDGRSRLV